MSMGEQKGSKKRAWGEAVIQVGRELASRRGPRKELQSQGESGNSLGRDMTRNRG